MKKAFTMIELIFVIVIIGILAAVAVPKLSATRTDAKIAAIAEATQNAVTEIQAYATAKGGDLNSTPIYTMSQVIAQLNSQGKGKLTDNSHTFWIYGDKDSDGNYLKCVEINASNDQTLYIKSSTGNDDGAICKGVKRIIKNTDYRVIRTVNF